VDIFNLDISIILILQSLLLLATTTITGYLAALSILALLSRKQKLFQSNNFQRFAVFIPSHNEALSIERTIKSIKEIDYPRENFDIVTIADNCNDDTASIARAAGSIVLERIDSAQRGKGFALRWGFDEVLPDSKYDAVVVVDADSIVSKNFLKVMNYYLEGGAQALQSSDLVEPQAGVWSIEATRIGFILYNYVRPMGRRVFGGHAGAKGNGMCFSTKALKEVPWTAFSLSEDLEYGLSLLIHGIPVKFAPEAEVLATMPSSAKNAESQRSRWEKGRLPIVRKYLPQLFRQLMKTGRFYFVDAILDLLIPPFVNLMTFCIIMAGLSFFFFLAGNEAMFLFFAAWLFVVTLGLLHVIIGFIAYGNLLLLVRGVGHLPRFVLWKLQVYTRMLREEQTGEWIRTTRETPLPSDEKHKGTTKNLPKPKRSL